MNTDEFKDRTTVVCHMRPRPEKTAQFRASLMALVQPTRAEPGSLAYELYEEPDGGLLLIETWALPDQPAITVP